MEFITSKNGGSTMQQFLKKKKITGNLIYKMLKNYGCLYFLSTVIRKFFCFFSRISYMPFHLFAIISDMNENWHYNHKWRIILFIPSYVIIQIKYLSRIDGNRNSTSTQTLVSKTEIVIKLNIFHWRASKLLE